MLYRNGILWVSTWVTFNLARFRCSFLNFAWIVLLVLYYLIYIVVLTEQEMIDSDAVAVSFAAKVHPWLAYVVTAGVCLSLIGSINITFLAAGRMPYVAGRMGFMPEVSVVLKSCD